MYRRFATSFREKRIGSRTLQFLLWMLLAIGVFLLLLSHWIFSNFGPITVNQALMNLPGLRDSSSETATNIAPGILNSFLLDVVIALGLIIFALAIVLYGSGLLLKHRFPARMEQWSVSRWAFLLLASSISLSGGLYYLDAAVSLRIWLFPNRNLPSTDTFYVAPVLEIPAAKDRNLVFIYLESMDDAFGNNSLVEVNALHELQAVTTGWERMDSLFQYPGGGWTMAGIISSQCGVPLLPPASENNFALDVEREAQSGQRGHNDVGAEEQWFLPGAVCLGDVLKESGYINVYMGGADTSFANKDKFLRSHGFETIFSRSYWEEHGETEFSEWGLSDRRLFENAKEEVLDLHASGQPFNLTMLTLDNHSPIHQFDYCPQVLKDETLNAIQCQSSILADFITFMDENGILEDTVVVLVADHQILSAYDVSNYRTKLGVSTTDLVPIFSRFWSPDGVKIERKTDNQLHIFPTVVDLLGGKLSNHRGGLGVSLTQPEGSLSTQVSITNLDEQELTEYLSDSSQSDLAELWKEHSSSGIPSRID